MHRLSTIISKSITFKNVYRPGFSARSYNTTVKFRNSLYPSEEEFNITKPISWYTCGPTVYDHSHIGHARNYVTVDIIQRILQNYFGVTVTHVMGMTDVDDKIINKSIAEKKSFTEIARHYENDFLDDMNTLGIMKPTYITRVSEHIPEIIKYIEGIIANGYGYVAPSGSVYFTVNDAQYPTFNERETSEEDNEPIGEKRNKRDFALWKAAKEGDPFWDSPWGKGRPGWHIECSAMISSVFGNKLDIHSGGIDLKYPHHQCEVAQCHAHNNLNKDQKWVSSFLHIGHIHIAGKKMSKSLKNFTTIKDFLRLFKPNQFRLMCLMNKYSTTIDYSPILMGHSVQMEKKLLDGYSYFTSYIKHFGTTSPNATRKWGQAELQLNDALISTKESIRESLANDFNTPVAMQNIFALISTTHAYLAKKDSTPPALELLQNVTDYIKSITDVFGLNLTPSAPTDMNSEAFTDLVKLLVNFRIAVKQTIRTVEGPELKNALMKECDNLRSNALNNIGLRIQDTSEGVLWTLVDKNLIKQQEAERLANLKADQERRALLDQQRSIPPSEMFRNQTDKYSKWDEQGLPLADKDGNPLTHSAQKKVKKLYEKQKESYEKHQQNKHVNK